jgi:hypothetical protein
MSPNIERRWKNKQEADGTSYHSSLIVELRMIKWRVEVLYYEIQEERAKLMNPRSTSVPMS